jgi:hypothetical protein
MKRTQGILHRILAACLVISVAGCAHVGHPIQDKQVKSIIPGKTTKNELIDLLGSPLDVVSRDGTINIPTIMVASHSNPYPSYAVRGDTFFTLFPKASDSDTIYYYHYSVKWDYPPVFLLLYFAEFGKTKTDRLWVLVNEKTEIVEDYAYKKYDKNIVFARSQ